MTENKLIKLGKFSQFIDYFFSYGIIFFFLLAIGGAIREAIGIKEQMIDSLGVGLKSVAITILIGTALYKYIKEMTPFGFSIYRNFIELTKKNISLKTFKAILIKKVIVNIVPFLYFLILVFIAIEEWFSFNTEDKVFFIIVGFIPVLFLLYQFCYFYIVNRFVNTQKETFSQNPFSTNENIIEENDTKKTSNKIKSKSSILFYRVKESKSSVAKKFNILPKLRSLNHNEIIILSIAIGAFCFILLAYGFAEIEKFAYVRGEKYYVSRDVDDTDIETTIKLNYGLAFPSFIITAGLCYLFLNNNKKKK